MPGEALLLGTGLGTAKGSPFEGDKAHSCLPPGCVCFPTRTAPGCFTAPPRTGELPRLHGREQCPSPRLPKRQPYSVSLGILGREFMPVISYCISP